MSEVLVVDGVSKKFKVYSHPVYRLVEFMAGNRIQCHREKWALKDVSLRLAKSESLALVGQNGSGKSTLLSIIVGSRVATTGNIELSGKVSALLELGMGFHPDFTGRENALMGLQIQGLGADDAEALLPHIESFSELGEYFDRTLRTYSSGMQMRLAFSVATAVRPEVLIVDEALSVGDVYFQHKSMGRIRELRDAGTSLLFVSHDGAAVKALCDRAILLDDGVIIREGAPNQIMDYYNAMIAEKERTKNIVQTDRGETRSGSRLVSFESVELVSVDGEPKESFRVGDNALIRCRLHCHESIDFPTVGVSIRDRVGNEVFGTNTWYLQTFEGEVMPQGETVVAFEVKLDLGVGSYSVTVATHTDRTHLENNYDWWDHACVFQVVPGEQYQFQGAAYLRINARIEESVGTAT